MGKFFGLLLLIVFAALVAGKVSPSPPAPPPPKLSPEEQAKKDADHARWVSQVLLVRALKKSMKNPDSFKVEDATELVDGTICISYRATNSFNAIVPGHAVVPLSGAIVTSDDKGRFAARWNATCAKKAGRNIRHIRAAL